MSEKDPETEAIDAQIELFLKLLKDRRVPSDNRSKLLALLGDLLHAKRERDKVLEASRRIDSITDALTVLDGYGAGSFSFSVQREAQNVVRIVCRDTDPAKIKHEKNTLILAPLDVEDSGYSAGSRGHIEFPALTCGNEEHTVGAIKKWLTALGERYGVDFIKEFRKPLPAAAPVSPSSGLPQVGEEIPGKGIYVGTWAPQELARTFAIYAAPEDVGGKGAVFDYLKMKKKAAKLEGWHGHRCEIASETAKGTPFLMLAGMYKGGWFVPPVEIVEDLLYPNRNKGKLAGSFSTARNGKTSPNWYWSSTQVANDGGRALIDFSDGHRGWNGIDEKQSTRLVRAEPLP